KQAKPTEAGAKSGKQVKPKRQRGSRWRGAFWALVIILIVLVLAAWYWFDHTNQQMQAVESTAQQSLRQAQQAMQQAEQALTQASNTESQLDGAVSQAGETKNRLDDLDKALQMLSDRGSDLVLINDIDHLVTVAHQQLLLGGNVGNAII